LSTSISDPNLEADRRSTLPDVPAADDLTTAALVSAADLAASGALDTLFEQIDSGRVQLSGAGGLLPELIKAVHALALHRQVADAALVAAVHAPRYDTAFRTRAACGGSRDLDTRQAPLEVTISMMPY
jgi:hypothetical protein